MDSEVLLRRWAATRTRFSENEITSVDFEHEDGWTNDSGTSWPEETTAVVRAGRRTETFWCETDIAALLREIVAASDG